MASRRFRKIDGNNNKRFFSRRDGEKDLPLARFAMYDSDSRARSHYCTNKSQCRTFCRRETFLRSDSLVSSVCPCFRTTHPEHSKTVCVYLSPAPFVDKNKEISTLCKDVQICMPRDARLRLSLFFFFYLRLSFLPPKGCGKREKAVGTKNKNREDSHLFSIFARRLC